MINFRFHIVSLIAVFLALALGAIFGSTVVDRAIVDNLRSQIDRVEQKADAKRAENDALRAENERLEQYVEDVSPFAVRNSLTGRTVSIVAMRGSTSLAAGAQAELARGGGAHRRHPLARGRGTSRTGAVDRACARSRASTRAGGRCAPRASRRSRPAWSRAPRRPALTCSRRWSRQASSPSRAPGVGRSCCRGLSGIGPVRAPGRRAGLDDHATGVRWSFASAPSTPRAGGGRRGVGRARGRIRARHLAQPIVDDGVADLVATVDDVDLPEGRVAAVLALSDVGRGIVGHYGYGAGAQAPLPEPVTTPVAR
jgi:hypothetical protein